MKSEPSEPKWFYWVVIVFCGLMLAVAGAQCSKAMAHDDHHDHEHRCFVQYAPDKVRDFGDLWTIKHRDGSKMVNYLMDDGNVVPERYEDAEQAEHWISRVYQQLRECD